MSTKFQQLGRYRGKAGFEDRVFFVWNLFYVKNIAKSLLRLFLLEWFFQETNISTFAITWSFFITSA